MKKISEIKKSSLYLILVALIIIVGGVTFFVKQKFNKAEIKPLAYNKEEMSELKTQSYAAKNLVASETDDKIIGSKKAALQFFVYEDYTNYYSAVLNETLEKIKTEVGNNIAFTVRPYFKNSPIAAQAALAVDCAGREGKWAEMRSLLLSRAKNLQSIGEDFTAYAQQLGLNKNNFAICLTNELKSGKIEKDLTEAELLGVQGSPTIFIGDEIILGARPYDDFIDSNGDKIKGLKTIVDEKLGQ